MEAGDKVEVNQIWTGCAPGYGEPNRGWIGGYEFLRREESGSVIVRVARRGYDEGCEVRFGAECVRKAGGKT